MLEMERKLVIESLKLNMHIPNFNLVRRGWQIDIEWHAEYFPEG